jgi:Uma2 family endonuclease
MSTAVTAPPAAEPETGGADALVHDPTPVAGDVLYEVIDGRVVEKPMGAYEALIATTLAAFLHQAGGANPAGRVVTEALFKLDPDRNRKRRPDVAFVSHERWPRRRPVPQAEAWEVVPELAVEVVSPSDLAVEVVAKIDEYFGAGVRLVWVIYPVQQLVYVYRSPTDVRILQSGNDLECGDAIPGFRLPVLALFEGQGDGEEEPAPPAA